MLSGAKHLLVDVPSLLYDGERFFVAALLRMTGVIDGGGVMLSGAKHLLVHVLPLPHGEERFFVTVFFSR